MYLNKFHKSIWVWFEYLAKQQFTIIEKCKSYKVSINIDILTFGKFEELKHGKYNLWLITLNKTYLYFVSLCNNWLQCWEQSSLRYSTDLVECTVCWVTFLHFMLSCIKWLLPVTLIGIKIHYHCLSFKIKVWTSQLTCQRTKTQMSEFCCITFWHIVLFSTFSFIL